VIQIHFNPEEISFKELVIIFMMTHNPTTLNRQGADVGTQYRSVIFYHNDAQKATSEQVFKEVTSYFENPIVTELSPAVTFHEAEDYHQNYYANNPSQGYCSAVISPKLSKLRQLYSHKLK
jgi:peptide-methionine (S)-S-oxide reductase